MQLENQKHLNLKIGDFQDPSPESFRRNMVESTNDPESDRYAPKHGIPALREQFALAETKDTGIPTTQDNILLTSGAWPALFACLSVLPCCRKVGFFSPYFFGFIDIVKGAGKAIWTLDLNQFLAGENLDQYFAKLEGCVFIHVCPHNPSGYVFTEADNEKIAHYCRKYNILVINDRVYKDLYDGHQSQSFRHYDPQCLEIWSVSKSCRMAGWRVGTITGLGAWFEQVKEYIAYSNNGLPTAIQKALVPVIELDRTDWRLEVARRRTFLSNELAKLGFGINDSKDLGTGFVWARLPKVFANAEDAAGWFEQFGVSVMPGTRCGVDGFLRLGLNYPTEDLQIAVERMSQALDAILDA